MKWTHGLINKSLFRTNEIEAQCEFAISGMIHKVDVLESRVLMELGMWRRGRGLCWGD